MNSILIFLFILQCISLSIATIVSFGDHEYKLFSTNAVFDRAAANCESNFGGYLASILSSAENAFIQQYVQTEVDPLFIGGKIQQTVFSWLNTSITTYQHNAFDTSTDACLAFAPGSGNWEPTSCTLNLRYLCKRTKCTSSSNACSSHGTCNDGACQCSAMYEGNNCQCVAPRLYAKSWSLATENRGGSRTWAALQPALTMSFNVIPNLQCLAVHVVILNTKKSTNQCTTQYRIKVNGNVIGRTVNLENFFNHEFLTHVTFQAIAHNIPLGIAFIEIEYMVTKDGCEEVWSPVIEQSPNRQIMIESFPCNTINATTISTSDSTSITTDGTTFMDLPLLENPLDIQKNGAIVRSSLEITRYRFTTNVHGLSRVRIILNQEAFTPLRVNLSPGNTRTIIFNSVFQTSSIGSYVVKGQVTASDPLSFPADNNGLQERRLNSIIYPCTHHLFAYSKVITAEEIHPSFVPGFVSFPTPFELTFITGGATDIIVFVEISGIFAMNCDILLLIRVMLDDQPLSIQKIEGVFCGHDNHPVVIRAFALNVTSGQHTVAVHAMSTNAFRFHDGMNSALRNAFVLAYKRVACAGISSLDTSVCSGHGTCIGENTCSCNVGFGGLTCEILMNAVCDQNNNCVCNNGWSGVWCTVPTCNSISASNPSVCSSHGTCVSPDQCSCNVGYNGTYCQIPICFGVLATALNTCSGHGTCISHNNCTCEQLYTSALCNVPKCNGTAANNPQVCNAHGQCTAPNICDCYSGYADSNCESFSCYNVSASSAYVCSGHGTCSFIDTCICVNGFDGITCNITACFGTRSDSASVCSSHGNCIAPNTCSCYTNWIGNTCDVPVCYSIASTSSTTCSGHGNCQSANTCICQQQYAGEACQFPKCFGKDQSNSSVCSSHGSCNSPDNCVCHSLWIGQSCSIPTCNSIPATNALVCSSRGRCTSGNTCECDIPYFGSNCESFACFGIHFSQTSVCSGHGTCVHPDLCNCENGYTGANCSIPICYSYAATDIHSCFAHGICTSKDNCTCFSDTVNGYWTGHNCSTCAPNYYGNQCAQFCEFSSTCSSHGTCNNQGFCECFRSVQEGHFTSQNCSQCAKHWYGAECLTTFSSALNITSDGRLLVTNFYIPEANTSSCTHIFDEQSLRKLGQNPRCYWPFENETLFVQVTSHQSYLLDDILMMRLSIYQRYTPVVMKLASNANISASLITPSTVIGVCDDLILDASASTASDGRELIFEWKLINSSYSLEFLRQFDMQKQSATIRIQGSVVPFGDHTFQVQAFHPLRQNFTSLVNVTKFPSVVPSPTIRGPQEQIIFSSDYVTIEGGFPPGDCEASDLTMVYHWRQIRGPAVSFKSNYNSHVFQPFTFYRYSNPAVYTFELMLSQYIVYSRKVFVSIIVRSQNLQARLVAPSIISVQQDLLLDASQSFDPERLNSTSSYIWSCFDDVLRTNCVLPMTASQQSSITINRRSLKSGRYTFSVMFKKDDRSATTFRTVQVIEEIPPSLILNPTPTVYPAHRRIVLSIQKSEPSVSYSWTCIPTLLKSQVLNSLTLPVLAIRENTFTSGNFVTCTITARKNEISASANVSFSISVPPSNGQLLVSPEKGNALDTFFKLLAFNFTGDIPFRYSFGYLDAITNASFSVSVLDISDMVFTRLPIGNPNNNYTITLFVIIQDMHGSETRVTKEVQSFAPQGDNAIQKLAEKASERVLAQLQVKDVSEALIVAGSLQSVFKNVLKPNDLVDTREQLLIRMAQTSAIQREIFTPKYVAQTASILMSFSSPAISISAKQSTLDVVGNILNSTSSASFSSSIAVTLSNMISGNSSSDQAISQTVARNSEIVAMQVSKSMQPGEQPVLIKTSNIEFIAAKEYSDDLIGKPIQQSDVLAKFPSAMKDILPSNSEPLNVFINIFKFNPYRGNISSSVMSLSISQSTANLKIMNLSSPIVFTFEANHSEEQVSAFRNGSGYLPNCHFWNGTNWSTDGCITLNVSTTNITCACNHLTDFASVVKYATPKLNVLSLDDLNLIGKVDSSNYTIVITICSFTLVYLMMLLILCVCRCHTRCIIQTSNAKTRIQSMLLMFIQSHTWLSTVMLPKEYAHFTRSQRITILFCGMLGMFCGNALTSETQENIVQMIAASVISDLISLPFVIMASFLFVRTDTRITAVMKVSSEISINLDNPTSNEMSNVSSSTSSQTSDHLYTKKETMKNRIHEFLNMMEIIFTRIENKATNALGDYRISLLLLAILSLCYFGCVAFISVILARAYPILLSNEYASLIFYAVGVISVDAYAVFLLVLFIYVRDKLYRRGFIKKWHLSSLAFTSTSAIGISLLLLLCTAVIAVYVFLKIHIYAFCLLLAGVGFLSITLVVLLIILNLSRTIRKQSSKPSRLYMLYKRLATFKFPWWTFIIWYLVCFCYIGVLTYLLISYGIKFSVKKSQEWLGSSFLALGLNVFVTNPCKLIAKLFLYQFLITLIEWILKPNHLLDGVDKRNSFSSQVEPEESLPDATHRINTYEELLQDCIDENDWEQADDYVKLLVLPDMQYMNAKLAQSIIHICYSFYSMYLVSLILDKNYAVAFEKSKRLLEVVTSRESHSSMQNDANFYYHACKAFQTNHENDYKQAVTLLQNSNLVDKVFVDLLMENANRFTQKK